jgi:hypothetical protein
MPPPSPIPPLTPVPTPQLSATEILVALLDGDHAKAGEVISQMSTNPLTTFVTMMINEEKKQAGDDKKQSNTMVDDSQCKR